MRTYTFIIVLVFLFKNSAGVKPRDLIDDAYYYLQNLMTATDDAVNDAMQKLWPIPQQLIDLGNSVTVESKPLIQEQTDIVLGRLNDIKNFAYDRGADITTCLDPQESSLHEVLDGIMLGLTQCVTHYVNEGITSVTQALANVNNIIEEVYALKREVDSCAETDEQCLTNVITEINNERINVDRRITEDVNYGISQSQQNKLIVQNCGFKRVEEIVMHGNNIVDAIQKCVDAILDAL